MSGSNGFQSSSYANDRPPSVTGGGDIDVATDPASSSFFLNDYKKWATAKHAGGATGTTGVWHMQQIYL